VGHIEHAFKRRDTTQCIAKIASHFFGLRQNAGGTVVFPMPHARQAKNAFDAINNPEAFVLASLMHVTIRE